MTRVSTAMGDGVPLQKMHICIIDDDPFSVDVISAILGQNGYVVISTYSCAREALDRIKINRPDLLITDIIMPELDGFALCEQLRSCESTRHIPVIMITGGIEDLEDAIEKTFAAGSTDFIAKPVNARELMARVRGALALKQTQDRMTEELLQRKKTEQELRESEQRFRTIIETTPDAVLVINDDGGIVLCNPSAEKLFGYSPDEILGNPALLLVPERRRRAAAAPLEEIKQQGLSRYTGTTFETTVLCKNGAETPVEISNCSWKTAQAVFYALIIRDITDRRHAEAERMKQEKFASILELAGAVCHELNQPLQAILGNVQLLAGDSNDNPQTYKLLKAVQADSEKMGEITKKLMAMTAYETKEYLSRKIVDIYKSSV